MATAQVIDAAVRATPLVGNNSEVHKYNKKTRIPKSIKWELQNKNLYSAPV